MPKIAEIREIDGEIWLKFERSAFSHPGPIAFYNEKELAALRKSIVTECIDSLRDLLETP